MSLSIKEGSLYESIDKVWLFEKPNYYAKSFCIKPNSIIMSLESYFEPDYKSYLKILYLNKICYFELRSSLYPFYTKFMKTKCY